MKKILLPLLSLLAVACGGGGSDSNSRGPDFQEVEEISGMEGAYLATFTTMNPQVNGTIPGSVTMLRKDDRLYVYARLFAGGSRAWHMQYIYTGTRCPTAQDDSNGDGFIDINEAEAVMGQILIPLDSDVSSQMSGRNFFPVADPSGSYHYERVTSYSRFMNDLRAVDKNPEDNIVKLGPDEKLNLLGRAVMFYGVSETVELPETVGTQGRRRPFQTLPIACGVFAKNDGTLPGAPGVNDQIPGPIAPVDPSADRPAAPGEGEISNGSGNYGSGTNSTDNGNTDHDGNGDDSVPPEVDVDPVPTPIPSPTPTPVPTPPAEDDSEDDDDDGWRWPWET